MPAAQQPQGGADSALDFLWMIVIIVGSIAAIWYFGHKQIISFILMIRLYELHIVQYILTGYGLLASYLHLPLPNLERLSDNFVYISSKPVDMSIQDLIGFSNEVGRYFAIPTACMIGIMGLITYFTNLKEKFNHVYNMETLRKSGARIWPQIIPVMKVNLVKKSLDEGPWASSLTPILFAKKHDLLIVNEQEGRIVTAINEGAAHRVFALQVGQFWRDILSLPLTIQALFAIFLARANEDRANADKLLAQISVSASSNHLDFRGVKEVVMKHKDSKLAQIAQGRHAYLLTVMATLLELARTDGVLATAEFLWLKPINRPLWYMLNSVGRQTAFSEVSGVYAHWLAEKKLGRPLKVPMVDEAVKALTLAVQEIIYEPEDE
jgi:intracellular multiplication protein IcmP